jgi:hypothetical protein
MNRYLKLTMWSKAACLLSVLFVVSLLVAAGGGNNRVYSDSKPQQSPPIPQESATGTDAVFGPAQGQQGEDAGRSPLVDCIPIWPPAADSFLWVGAPDSNYGALDLLWVGPDYRAPIQWTLPALPPRFMMSEAHANLVMVSFLVADPMTIMAHGLTQSWTEGGVTWNSRNGTNNWANPGGDFLAIAEDQVVVTSLTWPPYVWNLTDLVTEWYNGRRPNHGIILKSEGYPSTWYKRFGSKENAGYKPQLDVCYIEGPVALTAYTPFSWGVPSPDWYRFTRGSWWNVLAIRPSEGDYDLNLFSDSGYSTFLAGSIYSSNEIDYVVIDGNHAPGGFYYPRVHQWSGRGSYQVQHGDSTFDLEAPTNESLAVPRARSDGLISPSQANNTSPGVLGPYIYGPYEMTPEQVARAWDAWMISGDTYYFGVHPTSGDGLFSLALHRSDEATSSTYYQGRDQAVATSGPASEPGQPVFMSHAAVQEDWYGFLVLNHGATVSTTYQVYMDTTPPAGSMTIAGGAAYVNTVTVTLSLAAEDPNTGVYAMRFSNSGTPDGEWVDYAASHTWMLSGGDGVKTVYGQFRNYAGMGSAVYTDTVILDQTPPTASITCQAQAQTNTFPVNWSGADALSGVASYEVQYRVGDGSWSTWLPNATVLSATFGPTAPVTVSYGQTYSFRVRARDNAGNVGALSSVCSTYVVPPDVYLPAVMNQYSTCFAGPAEIEPNDLFTQANGPLCSGVNYTGTSDHNGSAQDSDYFYIQTTATGTINVQVTNFLSSNAQVQLYAHPVSAGTLLESVPDQPGGTYSIIKNNLPAGRYYVRVVATDGHAVGQGPYTLRVTFP